MTDAERLEQVTQDNEKLIERNRDLDAELTRCKKALGKCEMIAREMDGRILKDFADAIHKAVRDVEISPEHMTTCSAYDLISNEDQDTLLWVRDQGGINVVKEHARLFRVTKEQRDEYKNALRSQKRDFQDAENQRVELCSVLGIDTDTGWSDAIYTELEKRLMPEGYEWPRFESGEIFTPGDDGSIEFFGGGIVNVWIEGDHQHLGPGERVKRPQVLASDGEPLEVGQTVWVVENGNKFHVVNLCNDGRVQGTLNSDLMKYLRPEQLTHQRPVLDADGAPIHEDDMVYDKDNGDRFEVSGFSHDFVVCYDVDKSEPDIEILPGQLTHTKPETMPKTCGQCRYWFKDPDVPGLGICGISYKQFADAIHCVAKMTDADACKSFVREGGRCDSGTD